MPRRVYTFTGNASAHPLALPQNAGDAFSASLNNHGCAVGWARTPNGAYVGFRACGDEVVNLESFGIVSDDVAQNEIWPSPTNIQINDRGQIATTVDRDHVILLTPCQG